MDAGFARVGYGPPLWFLGCLPNFAIETPPDHFKAKAFQEMFSFSIGVKFFDAKVWRNISYFCHLIGYYNSLSRLR
jgi:hypothetical protein